MLKMCLHTRLILRWRHLCFLCLSLILCSLSPVDAATTDNKPSEVKEKNNFGGVGLDLENIELSQGEGGFEIWRLKAEWANMQRADSKITVSYPKLTYYMPPPDSEEMYVTATSGDIDQKAQLLRFVGAVRVWSKENLLTGELLIYSGTDQTMTFPEGGHFAGEQMQGSASLVRWHIQNKKIEALGNVQLAFSQPQDANID